MSDFIKLTIPWFLVILGWLVVHFFTIKREKEKRQFDELKDIQADLNDIFTISINYHSGNERNSTDEIRIISSLLFLEEKGDALFEILSHKGLKVDQKRWTRGIVFFRMAITTNNFGGDFSNQAQDSDIIVNISKTHMEIVKLLLEINKIFYR